MKAFVICAVLAAAPAFALADNLVARQGDDSVRLNDAPCASEQVLGRLPVEARQEYKAASAQLQGQNFSACWREMGSVAHLIYEDGDQGIIPLQELKRELMS